MSVATVIPGLQLELRPYQREALERIAAAEARGVRRQLGVAATGLGKTVIFCALAQQRGGRTLILAHRDELVGQAVKKVREIWPGVDVGIVKAGDNDVHAQVVVASVQTLARERRMGQLTDAYDGASILRSTERFDLVVVDEAHHTAADSYRRILDELRAGHLAELICPTCANTGVIGDDPCPNDHWHSHYPREAGPLLLGVTATPDRGDGKGLDDLFDEITWNFDILWGIRSGYLCDVRAQRVVLDALDLSAVRVRRGDFEAGAAGQAMEDANAPEAIAAAWRQYAAGRRTLVFTPTVEMARLTADAMRHQGVRAAMVHGGTPMDERRQILRDYSAGALDVVANCAVLTEGYDEPRTDCIIVARPTKSRALFTQMIGRGTRRHPDKGDLLVLDVVGGSDEHSLVTVPSLFGFEPEFAERMHNGSAVLTDAIDAQEQHLVRVGRMRAEDAELFRKVRAQGIAWVAVHEEHPDRTERRYQRTLTFKQDGTTTHLPTVVLVHRHDGDTGWLCGLFDPQDGAKRVLIADVELEMAQGVGEDYARKMMARYGKGKLIEADAEWRTKKPTPKQLTFARKLHLDTTEFKTAGEVSDAIDAKLAQKKSKKGTAA